MAFNNTPSAQDEALLARLNALKTSNVTFTKPPIFDDQRGDDDLATRFKNLQLTHQHTDSASNSNSNFTTLLPSTSAFPPSATLESCSRSQSQSPSPLPSPSLDDLLADLESELEDQNPISVNELNQARTLLEEANQALSSLRKESSSAAPPPPPSRSPPSRRGSSKSTKTNQLEIPTANQRKEEEEEEEEIESLSRILKDLPQPANSANKTSFDLPSPPRSPPRTATAVTRSSYSDAEIASWCAICCADAAVRCPGCAGELYCHQCWREGHQGEGAGWEERRHQWVGIRKGEGK